MVSTWSFWDHILKYERRKPVSMLDSDVKIGKILLYNFVVRDVVFTWSSGVYSVVRRFINSKNG